MCRPDAELIVIIFSTTFYAKKSVSLQHGCSEKNQCFRESHHINCNSRIAWGYRSVRWRSYFRRLKNQCDVKQQKSMMCDLLRFEDVQVMLFVILVNKLLYRCIACWIKFSTSAQLSLILVTRLDSGGFTRLEV